MVDNARLQNQINHALNGRHDQTLIELGQYLGEACEHDHGLHYNLTTEQWECARCRMVMP